MGNVRQIAPTTHRRTHPGEVLREEFMVPLSLSANALARYFGTTAQFGLNLQRAYDLSVAEIDLAAELATIMPRQRQAA